MPARQLPNVDSFTLLHVYYEGIRAGSVKYITVYSNTRLKLITVIFKTASQFASLLSALPNLAYILCNDIVCHRKQCILPFPGATSSPCTAREWITGYCVLYVRPRHRSKRCYR
ncbi:hypothetical protein DAEQUDRAFT_556889 [Daedalea quercina L-15889]|uniref:Uncharacterized protein n=1 Tax=Daedalea quercina L-15889 TaxID=1314783 RepID=A0A165T5X1_9APHY|nr:hypothetical protein DAEQUDRAFT_556889 [Daedalea quercina L-15889]